MSPIEAYLNGKFSGKTAKIQSGILIGTQPSHYILWSGDDSPEQKVLIFRLDEENKLKIPVAEASLPKTGDKLATDIEVFKESTLFRGVLEPVKMELKLLRTLR